MPPEQLAVRLRILIVLLELQVRTEIRMHWISLVSSALFSFSNRIPKLEVMFTNANRI